MPDLTELQRLAEEAGAGLGEEWLPEAYLRSMLTHEEAAYIAAMNPDTAKKLIAVALAAEMLYADTLDYIRVNNLGDPNNYGMRAVHTALEELK